MVVASVKNDVHAVDQYLAFSFSRILKPAQHVQKMSQVGETGTPELVEGHEIGAVAEIVYPGFFKGYP